MSSACAADNVNSSPLRGLFVVESTHHALPDPSADLRVPSSGVWSLGDERPSLAKELADLVQAGPDGPTGGYFDANGPVAW